MNNDSRGNTDLHAKAVTPVTMVTNVHSRAVSSPFKTDEVIKYFFKSWSRGKSDPVMWGNVILSFVSVINFHSSTSLFLAERSDHCQFRVIKVNYFNYTFCKFDSLTQWRSTIVWMQSDLVHKPMAEVHQSLLKWLLLGGSNREIWSTHFCAKYVF